MERGQIYLADIGIAFLVIIVLMGLTLVYLDLVASRTRDMLQAYNRQEYLITYSDSLINNPSKLAKYDEAGERVLPHVIDKKKIKSNENYSIYPLNSKIARTGISMKRLVFVDDVGRENVYVLEVW